VRLLKASVANLNPNVDTESVTNHASVGCTVRSPTARRRLRLVVDDVERMNAQRFRVRVSSPTRAMRRAPVVEIFSVAASLPVLHAPRSSRKNTDELFG
jgi:hypothetical protein